ALLACYPPAPSLGVAITSAIGPRQMSPFVADLARLCPHFVFSYPNAGLPNEFGGYDMGPQELATALGAWARDGWLNLVGGCCGTTPEHIAAIADAVRGSRPRVPPKPGGFTHLSGLESLTIRPGSNFIMVGERTHVASSRKFTRLILEQTCEGAS